jgi:hypothetical protein
MSSVPDPKRELLRHTLATLAYRGGKVLRGAPESFPNFRCGADVRRPLDILAHICDLMDWGLSMADGRKEWKESKPELWEAQVERFFIALKVFDDYLASDETLHSSPEKLFQGPVADALTHVGQIAMLRRMAGSPIRGENYFVAEVASGRVGAQQAAPKREFD